MFKCPYGERQGGEETADAFIGRWVWHQQNCTCVIMDFYQYFMLEQSNHCKDYWENTGKIKVKWSPRFGMTLEYPVTIMDIMDVRYPYRD